MTGAEELALFAEKAFPDIVPPPEAVGRLLIARSTAGPRLWTGIRILRALGILIDSGSLSS
ncbi:hypothetical protein EN850_02850 [Mesorhizobium sp. M8A.F.Ca.ET.207.01.1.1]|uniref:hypothetical protein n=1 Tax=Mesorhizobium sp. M8A.F.Ca.ET.207.01.1.1 TaxID=2563968 RepID=UPI00109C9077|nr:hypothetical protein [Mesorhizobium sp. M8A.F.Ca.ET.207.01.1.1]TGQ83698.1 hypothetical protein EN850_02850 [Mesorhizobium sp. M8A.F.Ca.ET.207.01.1.1]